MNWMQVETYLRRDDRAVLPLGCTEQHAYLSLATDSILAERVALEAAEPLGVPVFPVVPYGLTPYFMAYPGTLTLRAATYFALVGDLLDSFAAHGFRRILLVNGHGGNSPVQGLASEWMGRNSGCRVKLHNWWNAPRAWAAVQAIDPVASHASWMENFPWTRLGGVTVPGERKAMVDLERLRRLDPQGVRDLIGDGGFGGYHARADREMETIWREAVEETRERIAAGWD